MFFQTLGGALFISTSQTVFQNGIVRGVRESIPALDPQLLLRTGATDIRNVLAKVGLLDQLPTVLKAYMVGLTDSFRVAVTCTSVAFFASLFFEWKSVKDEEALKKKEAARDLEIAV